MALYLLAGVAGVPWFANQQSGWAFASFGYIVGFVAAAWLVGQLAERGADRRVVSTIGMMALGNVVIYVFGVAGLMLLADLPLGTVAQNGQHALVPGDVTIRPSSDPSRSHGRRSRRPLRRDCGRCASTGQLALTAQKRTTTEKQIGRQLRRPSRDPGR